MNSTMTVIRPSGVLDNTKAGQFRNEIDEMIRGGADRILVDLKEVTFMDSSGLGALVIAMKAIQSAGGNLSICSINEQVKILFDLTSMDQVFEIFDDQEAFNKALLTSCN
jgi:anti-sigma B factor antagonist